jgi:prepilin-type N-terminal cleavage/methylation domain-containing protein
MRKRVLGFTLIELMIVIAIIAIIAAIAIPGLLRARMSANEGSASASLRSLASAQASFAKAATVDQDQDGQGEYGTLNELTGTAVCRAKGAVGVAKVAVGDMSVAMAATAVTSNHGSGIAAKSGYYYHIYLPGVTVVSDQPQGAGLTGYDNLAATDENDSIQQQENRWICYSWPATFKSSGMRAFVCDQSAEVYASANTDGTAANLAVWDGTKTATTEPAYSDAMRNETGGTPDTIYWTNICVRDKTNAYLPDSHLWVPSQ